MKIQSMLCILCALQSTPMLVMAFATNKPNDEWSTFTCYDCGSKNPCDPLATEGLFYYPRCDKPDNFVKCSEYSECFVMSCPKGLTWDQRMLTCVPKKCEYTEDDGEDKAFFTSGVELKVDCEKSHVTEHSLRMAYLSYFNAAIDCECPGNKIEYTDVIVNDFKNNCDDPERREMRSEETNESDPTQRRLASASLTSSQDSRGFCGNTCPSNPFPGLSGFRRRHLKKKSKSKDSDPVCGDSLFISIFAEFGIGVEKIKDVEFEKVSACKSAFACDEKECCKDLAFNACPKPKDECHCDFVNSGHDNECTKSSCVERLDLSAAPPKH